MENMTFYDFILTFVVDLARVRFLF